MLTTYTSFGFGLCGYIYAIYGNFLYSGILISLNNVSILHHVHLLEPKSYYGGYVVSYFDRLLARILFLKTLYDTLYYLYLNFTLIGILKVLPVLIGHLYTYGVFKIKIEPIEYYKKGEIYYYHASMHVVSQILFIYALFVLDI